MSLLLLFNSNQASSGGQSEVQQDAVPYILNIQDADTKQPVPVLGYQAGNAYLQSVSISQSGLRFYEVGTSLSGGEKTNILVLNGRSRIVVGSRFSSLSATAEVFLVREDINGLSTATRLQILPTQVEVDGRYLGESIAVESLGAKRVWVYVGSVSDGVMDILLAEV